MQLEVMYPLYWAGFGSIGQQRQKQHLVKLQKLLLCHGANPYATFEQPLRPTEPVNHPYREELEVEYDYTVVDIYECIGDGEPSKYNAYRINADTAEIAEAKERCEEYDDNYDDEFTFPTKYSWTPEKYGIRSLIHAMLEDGGLVKPILDLPNLDIERKDPQGRTMLLSACRSALGADCAIDGFTEEIYVHDGIYFHNPLPKQPNRFKAESMTPETTTLFEYFVNRGADLLVTDNYGKNAVFQLLESHSINPDRPWVPFISHSLKALIRKAPQLVHQLDNAGNHPLHAALRRLHRLNKWESGRDFTSETYGVVYELLDAGADPKAIDELGNTALHQLANDTLARGDTAEHQRQLFTHFVKSGVDINAPNKSGYTAVRLFIEDDSTVVNWERELGLAADTLGFFESSGAVLNQKDPKGQTLLHLVAKQDTTKAAQIAKHLLQEGLDPKAPDGDGNTPIDLAREVVPRSFHESLLDLLEP
jgi:ankyrin repeat protein